MSWRRVPLSSRLFVQPKAGRVGRLVRALTGASDWRRVVADRLGTIVVAIAGPSVMPGAGTIDWPPGGLDRVGDELRSVLPGLQLLGAVVPRQSQRQRLSLLGRMTGGFVVVKIGGPPGAVEREGDVLVLLADDPLPGIDTPVPVGRGVVDLGGTATPYLATTAPALRRQRAAIDEPLRTFETDLARRLGGLAKGSAPDGSVPVHGDLTPWNLRRTPRGLALFDWESAGWGPPGSDLASYRTSCDEVRRPWNRRPPTGGATPGGDLLGARR